MIVPLSMHLTKDAAKVSAIQYGSRRSVAHRMNGPFLYGPIGLFLYGPIGLFFSGNLYPGEASANEERRGNFNPKTLVASFTRVVARLSSRRAA